jgi:hypothetical protein
MFNFLAVNTVRFDEEFLREVARSSKVTSEMSNPTSDAPVSRQEIEQARKLVTEYFLDLQDQTDRS